MKVRYAIMLTAGLAILACGGGGGDAPVTNSPFAGTWQGTWNSAALGQNGTASVTIASNGAATGTTFNNQLAQNGTISGSVNNAGQFNGTSQYPGNPASPISGTLALSNNGANMTGNMTQNIGGTNYPVVFALTKQ